MGSVGFSPQKIVAGALVGTHLPPPSRQCRERQRTQRSMGVCCRIREASVAESALPPAPQKAQERFFPLFFTSLLVGTVVAWRVIAVKKRIEEKKKLQEQDPRAYTMALARTRQAIYVQRSIGFMNTGNPARALVEVERALKENAICRSPLLSLRYSDEEIGKLFRLHLQNSDFPPEYATLLQLREMLNIDPDDADRIEMEVMENIPYEI